MYICVCKYVCNARVCVGRADPSANIGRGRAAACPRLRAFCEMETLRLGIHIYNGCMMGGQSITDE
jgi:hypothetical protein